MNVIFIPSTPFVIGIFSEIWVMLPEIHIIFKKIDTKI